MTDEDVVPVSVRLGEVVPPEDPEDWTRPLTWMAAAGMLVPPALAVGWFAVSRPTHGEPLPMTWVLAATIAAGAALTGASQAGRRWAFAGALGAGLFAALATVIVGLALSGERQVGAPSPPLAHAILASATGLAATLPAAAVGALLADRSRIFRWIVAVVTGLMVIGCLIVIT